MTTNTNESTERREGWHLFAGTEPVLANQDGRTAVLGERLEAKMIAYDHDNPIQRPCGCGCGETISSYPVILEDAEVIRICDVGMHASPTIWDALGYVASANLFTRVVVEGEVHAEVAWGGHDDKFCGRYRTILAMVTWDEMLPFIKADGRVCDPEGLDSMRYRRDILWVATDQGPEEVCDAILTTAFWAAWAVSPLNPENQNDPDESEP